MTNERPTENARCWLMNTADRPVDVYVNDHAEPLTTIKPEEDQGVFTIDSNASGVYGTYTFAAREKDDPDGPVLASASVAFAEGDSYTAVFRGDGGADYAFSIYGNDFSPSADSRFEIRQTGAPAEVDWRLFPKAEADPRIPEDERAGTLERGQWQQAIDVTENEYRLEILVDGEVVAFRQDLELEAERMIVVYLVGDPKPWMGSDEKEGHVFRQEFQIRTGPKREDAITPPAEPVSSTDRNRTIRFDCEPLRVYHTNAAEATVGATDPDGFVSGLAIEDVEPPSDGFTIPDESVDRAYTVGGTTTATLRVQPKVPPGVYDVWLQSNPESLGERVTCTVPVEVMPITVERLRDLVTSYHAADDMTDAVADDLYASLYEARQSLPSTETPDGCVALAADLRALIERYDSNDDVSRAVVDDLRALLGDDASAGDTGAVCAALADVVALVGERKDEGISAAAAVDIETEAGALRKRLGCE